MVINLAKNSNVGKPNQQIIFLSRHASVKKHRKLDDLEESSRNHLSSHLPLAF